jgi:hypothetical protein
MMFCVLLISVAGTAVDRCPVRDTVAGERVAAIVPESLIEALRAAEDAEDIAEADAAMDEPGESVSWDQVKAELGL